MEAKGKGVERGRGGEGKGEKGMESKGRSWVEKGASKGKGGTGEKGGGGGRG